MLRYTTFQYYIEFFTPVILGHLWHLPFGAKIVLNITWKMAFLTWTKPGDNLEFFRKKNWEPCHLCVLYIQYMMNRKLRKVAEPIYTFVFSF